MAWIETASTLLNTKAGEGFGGALAGALGTEPAGPSSVIQRSDPLFDGSGWNVIFGDGNTLKTDRTQREGANTFDQYVPYVIAAAGVLIVWRLTKRAA